MYCCAHYRPWHTETFGDTCPRQEHDSNKLKYCVFKLRILLRASRRLKSDSLPASLQISLLACESRQEHITQFLPGVQSIASHLQDVRPGPGAGDASLCLGAGDSNL